MINDIVSLEEIKEWLNKKDGSDDQRLQMIATSVSRFIETYCSKLFMNRDYVEYFDGGGKKSVMVSHYPIYDVSSIYDDPNCEYGSGELIASTNYVIDFDPGKITLIADYYQFYNASQNVKVSYSAGYSRFNVIDEQNNYLDITDDGGTVAIEISAATARFSKFPGYDVDDLASAIQTALNLDETLTGTYVVVYDHNKKKFKITSDGEFSLLITSGANSHKSIFELLGFLSTTDREGETEYVSDFCVDGLPEDLKMAAKMICHKIFKDAEGGLIEKRTVLPENAGTVEWVKGLPVEAKMVLDSYQRAYL